MAKQKKTVVPDPAPAPAGNADRTARLFTMRLSVDERARLEAAAQAAGTGCADVIREATNAMCDAKGIAHVFVRGGS